MARYVGIIRVVLSMLSGVHVSSMTSLQCALVFITMVQAAFNMLDWMFMFQRRTAADAVPLG